MQRRKMLAALGSVAIGGATAVSTGAFTSVEADRQVDVQVASDANAYLSLTNSDEDNSEYFDDSGDDEFSVNFADTSEGGSGVNPNADTIAEDVFTIENQGTQEVDVSLSSGSGDIRETEGVNDDLSAPTDEGITVSLDKGADDSTLGVGDSINVDFAIHSGTDNLSGELTIKATADN